MSFICSPYDNFVNKVIDYESGKCKGVVLHGKERGGCRWELPGNGQVEHRNAYRFVPPFGEYPHVGGDLSVLLTVAELVTERTRLAPYRRRTEF